MREMLFVESVAQEVYGQECFPTGSLQTFPNSGLWGGASSSLTERWEAEMLKHQSSFHPKHWIVKSTLCPFFFHLLTKLQGVQLQIYSVCQSMCGKMPWWSSTECGDSLPLDYGFNPQHLATASIKWCFGGRSPWWALDHFGPPWYKKSA